MTQPAKKLSESLEILRNLQVKTGGGAVRSDEISRVHRERLSANGFLQEIARGWYLVRNPAEKAGDTTSWFTSYWSFCSRYLTIKYGEEYCLSADQSLLIHAGNLAVPDQLIVLAPKAPNKRIPLLFGTSFFEMKSTLPTRANLNSVNGIRILSLPLALINCSRSLYEKNSMDLRTALAQVKNPENILKPLIEGSHSVVAGKLAGAFRNNNQNRLADEIMTTMNAAGFAVRETNPFSVTLTVEFSSRDTSPYATRIRLMWQGMRDLVIKEFPEAPGIPSDPQRYMKLVDQLYTTDAYHSLSIEFYKVTIGLIEKIRSGDWDLETNEEDKKQRDAMAAKGYWQAVQAVKRSIVKILNGSNPGETADLDHPEWYRELFAPSVATGLIKSSDLSGYRTSQVYIGQSRHIPLSQEAVRAAMPVLFEMLVTEPHPAVRVVLGHFFFAYIHPYMDGNGRIARFLMNVMLASGGYPWTVIPLEQRDDYMHCLEMASVNGDIEPFSRFIASLVTASLNGHPVAKLKVAIVDAGQANMRTARQANFGAKPQSLE